MQVQRLQNQVVEEIVPKNNVQIEERNAEVPQVCREAQLVEASQVQVVKPIGKRPDPQVQMVQKQVPKVGLQAQIEIVDAPSSLTQEQPVEVPQIKTEQFADEDKEVKARVDVKNEAGLEGRGLARAADGAVARAARASSGRTARGPGLFP